MTVIVDAAPIIAMADRRDPAGQRVLQFLRPTKERLIVPCPVTAEIDYLLMRRRGEQARRAFLSDVAARRFEVSGLEPSDYLTVLSLEEKYADLRPGLADLSVVVLAARFGTTRILTFDNRHFRAMTPLQGGAFELLPDLSDS